MSDDKPYDYDEFKALADRLFPFEPEFNLGLLFGVGKKQAARWYTGYNRPPPRIVEKMRIQAQSRVQLAAGLEALLADADAAGLRRQVQRGVVMDVIKSGRFDVDEEPL